MLRYLRRGIMMGNIHSRVIHRCCTTMEMGTQRPSAPSSDKHQKELKDQMLFNTTQLFRL